MVARGTGTTVLTYLGHEGVTSQETGKMGENGQRSTTAAIGVGQDRRFGMSGSVPTERLPDRYRLAHPSANRKAGIAPGWLNAQSGHGEPRKHGTQAMLM